MDYSRALERVTAWADADDNIRAVVLTGSAAAGTEHPLSDRDVELHVRDSAPLETDDAWWRCLGSVLAVERLTNHAGEPTRLVSYTDGKLDFTLVRAGGRRIYDLPFRVLLDKDGAASTVQHQPQHREPPNQVDFDECCNWACAAALMTAKAIVRDEPWSEFRRRTDLMNELLRLVEWDHVQRYHGERTLSHLGTQMRRWMDADNQRDLATVAAGPGCEHDHGEVLLAVFELITKIADRVAQAGGLSAFPLDPVRAELKSILASRHLDAESALGTGTGAARSAATAPPPPVQ